MSIRRSEQDRMIGMWSRHRTTILDGFVISNLAFLAVDIYFAHSINDFANAAEWIPFAFSLMAPCLLMIFLILASKNILQNASLFLVNAIGYVSIGIGILGMIYHLESQFFRDMSIKSLVYTAPFIAPLAYSGLGFLILLNRKVSSKKKEWSLWIVFFAMGGFFGNFILSLCDHAQNGFYYMSEWIPVVASAFAVGFLMIALWARQSHEFLKVTMWVLIGQIAVGALGFYFHLMANLAAGTQNIFENFVFGAPVFAPLLFADLAILAVLGIYDLDCKLAFE